MMITYYKLRGEVQNPYILLDKGKNIMSGEIRI